MPKTIPCKSCGDPIPSEAVEHTGGRCIECYREVEFGEVPVVTDSSHGGRGARGSGSEPEDTDGGASPEDFEGIGSQPPVE